MASGWNDRRLAEQCFDRDFALVRRLVREHRLAGHVADRQDVRVGRALLLVGDDEAFSSISTSVFSRPKPRAVRPAADRDQHAAEALGCGAVGVFEVDFDRLVHVGERDDLGFQVDAGEDLLQPLVQRLDQVAIGAGQQRRRQFDDASPSMPSSA